MNVIRAWAALSADRALEPCEFDPGPLGAEEVEIAVEYRGICQSDLSVIDNEWDISSYPVVPGHEAVGRVVALGDQATGLTIGQRVGAGWNSGCCLYCPHCLAGDQQLCARIQPTIVGHRGAFADWLRAHWVWVIPIPEALDASAVGPLLCGGITVFSPLLNLSVKPTQSVGVVGIGGPERLGL